MNEIVVLSVDDNEQNRLLIEKALKDPFKVISSDGNESLVGLVEKYKPTVVLLDIMLGDDRSGYDLCQELRLSGIDNNLVVIFVSALTTLDDKLKAYAVGGDDYICKPIDLIELREKIIGIDKRIREFQSLNDNLEYSTSVAFASMKQASELGQLFELFENFTETRSLNQVYENIRNYMVGNGIKFSCELRNQLEAEQYSESVMHNLESEVLSKGIDCERIIQFGKNILFNSKYCSILIKGVDVDSPETGRIRDNLAILLKLVDSRMQFFEAEAEKLNERVLALKSLKAGMIDNFNDIRNDVSYQDERVEKILAEFSVSFNTGLITLGLDEEQENKLYGMIADLKSDLFEALNTSITIEKKLTNINVLLNNVD